MNSADERVDINLPSYLSDEIIRDVWIAFRSRYMSFSGGREKFAIHVEEAVLDAETKFTFRDSTGAPMPEVIAFPTPQTYYNFVKRGLTNILSGIETLESDRLRANSRTLLVIMKYLYGVGGVNMHRLMEREAEPVANGMVENLDYSFVLFDPAEKLPDTIALLKIPSRKQQRKISWLIDNYENGHSTLKSEHLELAYVLRIVKTRESSCRIFLIQRNMMFPKMARSEKQREELDEEGFNLRGECIAFQSKDFQPPSKHFRAGIEDGMQYCVIEYLDRLSQTRGTISLRFSVSAISDAFDSPDFQNVALSMVEIKRPGHKREIYTAFPASIDDCAAIDYFCNSYFNGIK